MQEELIVIDPRDVYTHRRTMRRAIADARTVVSTLPLEVVARAARKRGLTLSEFIARYEVEYLFDGVEGAFFRFVEKDGGVVTPDVGTV